MKARTLRALAFTYSGQLSNQVVGFVLTVVLARLLTPEEFGVVAMLAVFVALADVLADMGLGSAIIQKKDPDPLQLSSVFWLNAVLGGALYGVLFAAAPWIAKFYSQESLGPLLRVMALTCALNALCVVHRNLLAKEIAFGYLAAIRTGAVLAGGLCGVLMAWKGCGPWSLVGQSLVISLSSCAAIWTASRWRPGWAFRLSSIRGMIHFSAYLLASNLLETFFRWLDVILIGRVFSAVDVGLFNRAKNVQNLPVNSLSSVLKQVMFPVFSKLQDDPEKLRWAYRQSMTGVFFLVCPVMAALSLCSYEVIEILYGAKWMPAAPLLCALSLAGMLYPISSFNVNILVVLGKTRLYFRNEMVKKGVIVAFMVIGLQGGLLGLAVGQVAAAVVCTLLNMALAGPFIRFPLGKQVADLLPTLGVSAVSAGLAWWAGSSMDLAALPGLVLKGSVMAAVYLLLSALFFRESFRRILDLARDFRSSRSGVRAEGFEGEP